MKTYFNTFQFKNEATLNVTTTATLKEDTYIFNFDIEVFDHNSLSNSELERVFYSTFSQEFKEDKVFDGSAHMSIHQRIIAEIASFTSEVAMSNNVSFNFFEFYDFAYGIFYFYREDQSAALDCFHLESPEFYQFELDLEELGFCTTMKEFAIKYDCTYKRRDKLLCDHKKLSKIFGLNENTVYKYCNKILSESYTVSKMIRSADEVLSHSTQQEELRIKSILNS
ncbi:hypothetical protein AB0537_001266 [Vibrio parahaemolyticus]